MRATHYTEHIDFRAKKSIQMKGVHYSRGRMLYRYSSGVLLWSLFWGRTVVGWTPLSTTTHHQHDKFMACCSGGGFRLDGPKKPATIMLSKPWWIAFD